MRVWIVEAKITHHKPHGGSWTALLTPVMLCGGDGLCWMHPAEVTTCCQGEPDYEGDPYCAPNDRCDSSECADNKGPDCGPKDPGRICHAIAPE